MARALRALGLHDSHMYFVTCRTLQGRRMLRGTALVNSIIAAILAKAAALYGVQVHGYVVLLNHIHLLVTAGPHVGEGAEKLTPRLVQFMTYFNGNVATKIGLLANWKGHFWHGRYHCAAVLTDEAAQECLHYILSHGVKEGLVSHPSHWPGLNCLKMLRRESEQTYRLPTFSQRWSKSDLRKGGEDKWDKKWTEEVCLRLTPLPGWCELTATQRRKRVDAMVNRIVADGARKHGTFLGAKKVSELSMDTRFETPRRNTEHRWYFMGKKRTDEQSAAEQEYLAKLDVWRRNFMEASLKFRGGALETRFPKCAFRPVFVYEVPYKGPDPFSETPR